jgi:methyl-accepting chemotaxis protein
MNVVFAIQAVVIAACGATSLFMTRGITTPLEAYALLGASVGLSLAIGYVMARAVTKPYAATVLRMEALAAGDLDSPIAHTAYTDCVGRMAVAMCAFKEAALANKAAERAATEARSRADGDRTNRDAEKAEHATDTAFAISSIATALKQLADGNVAYRVETPLPGEADRLRGDFNRSMVKLQQTLQSVGSNAHSIRTGSKEVAVATDELARRTEKQAASLEETAAALGSITETVRKTAEGAIHARQVVTTAKGDAEASGVIAQNAVDAMKGIAASSRQIGQIIGVIDEIAFQTNLLALNAGVEAARAGEAGRGFAVVASEVRALAQRSAQAAKEIKSLISNSTSHVDKGVDLVTATGQALGRIVTHVAEINAVVSEIAASAQEQSVGLQEVNVAVTQMDQMTQQNAAMVEETTAASQSMLEDVEGLSLMLGRFNLGDAGKVVDLSAARSPARAAPTRPAVAKARGSALRKPDPVEAGDSWEEF